MRFIFYFLSTMGKGRGKGSAGHQKDGDADSWSSKMPVFVLSFLLFVVVIMMMRNDSPSASSQRPHDGSLVSLSLPFSRPPTHSHLLPKTPHHPNLPPRALHAIAQAARSPPPHPPGYSQLP